MAKTHRRKMGSGRKRGWGGIKPITKFARRVAARSADVGTNTPTKFVKALLGMAAHGGPPTPPKTPKMGRKSSGLGKTLLRLLESQQKTAQQISQHNDMSFHYVPCTHVPKKKMIKTLGNFQFQVVKSTLPGQPKIGEQGITTLPACFTREQMTGLATSGDKNDQQHWPEDPFLYNPYSTIPNNTIYATAPMPAVVSADKICIKNVRWDLQLVNLKNVACEVQVYWLMATTNHNVDPYNAWRAVLEQEEGNLQNAPAIRAAFSDSSATPGSRTPATYGNDPFQCKTYKKFWKPIAQKSIILQPGDNHNLRTMIKLNKILTREWLSLQGNSNIQGLTIYPMIISRGSITGISVTTDGVAQEVDYAPTHVGIMTNYNVKFAAVPINRITQKRIFPDQVINNTYHLRTIDDTDQVVNEKDA